MTSFRLTVKTVYAEANNIFKDVKHIVIYGINENAITTKSVLTRDTEISYKVEAFIDPSGSVRKKQLDAIKFYNENELPNIFKRNNISELIITDKSISPSRKQEIIDVCLEYDVKVLTLPEVHDWINGELSYRQIRKINIEDLLERPPINLNAKQIKKDILNKTILVTGAAGSIGREIVLQLTEYHPKNIIIFDQAESPLYDLELELKEKLNFHNFDIVIGDVTNIVRINKLFHSFNPGIVYHAAAYKHVPMMEANPSEAVRTNVFGTSLLANLAVRFKVEKFIMISTDKAVKPTSVMGASKRIAEMYTQAMNSKNGTRFITTRFGNVLGSNGSVIPLFRDQISKGGPVTVTHPEITRYFMTIPEACQLVLEAGAMGKGGEIFIFDMGQSIKIVDLAKKMIMLSGLTLGSDIQIKYTGLRPGEKLYEELLNDEENTLPTHHPQIMIARERGFDLETLSVKVKELIAFSDSMDGLSIVKKMKEIAPEFKSRNSVYEQLDTEE
ncbi:MAG: polysaccharide biosynthesis protein [Bacteroidales bacterium]|nr:polysaccharide biosynthesis protein [Bacteroidales bacterium]